MRKNKLHIYFFASVVILTVQFKTNFAGVVEDWFFEGFASQTESYIVGRLALTEQQGLFVEGGMIGNVTGAPEEIKVRDYQYQVYFEDLPIQQYLPYKSTHALQSFVFGLIDSISPFEDETNHQLFLWLSSLFSALMFSLFLRWAAEIFGLFSSFFCLLCIFLSPWLVVSGGHLYWISGSLLIPFIVGLYLHKKERDGKKTSGWLFFILTALGLFAKCLFTGYEIITSVLVLSTIPVFFYAVLERWNFQRFIRRFSMVSAAGLAGVLMSMGLLIIQINLVEKNSGTDYIKQRFLERTTGEGLKDEIPIFKGSIEASIPEVITIYLNAGAFRYKFRGGAIKELKFNFFICMLIVLGLAQLLFFKDNYFRALLISGFVGLLSPLSWFVIFKSHSYLHPFLNCLSWYFPFMLLLYLGIGHAGKLLWVRFKHKDF